MKGEAAMIREWKVENPTILFGVRCAIIRGLWNLAILYGSNNQKCMVIFREFPLKLVHCLGWWYDMTHLFRLWEQLLPEVWRTSTYLPQSRWAHKAWWSGLNKKPLFPSGGGYVGVGVVGFHQPFFHLNMEKWMGFLHPSLPIKDEKWGCAP